MVRLSKGRRITLALGGFLIFVGVVIAGILLLVLTQTVDVSAFKEIFETSTYRMLFLGMLLAIGILDIISGIILRRQ